MKLTQTFEEYFELWKRSSIPLAELQKKLIQVVSARDEEVTALNEKNKPENWDKISIERQIGYKNAIAYIKQKQEETL